MTTVAQKEYGNNRPEPQESRSTLDFARCSTRYGKLTRYCTRNLAKPVKGFRCTGWRSSRGDHELKKVVINHDEMIIHASLQ